MPSGQCGISSGHRSDARRCPPVGVALPHLRKRQRGEYSVLLAQSGRHRVVREKSKSLEVIVGSLAGGSKSRYAWLEWDGAAMAGKFLQRPEREEIPENIKEQLIVELYSK